MKILRYVHITGSSVVLDGSPVLTNGSGLEMLTDLYRRTVSDYPKFFKMDPLCKLGMLAAELLVKDDPDRFAPRRDRAVLLFSKSGCVADDLSFQATIAPGEYFPSPALFVYTLPNIVTGEIAIRNKYQGDATAFEIPDFDSKAIEENVRAAFLDNDTRSAVCGWVDCPATDSFEALLMLVSDEDAESECQDFSSGNIEKLKNI